MEETKPIPREQVRNAYEEKGRQIVRQACLKSASSIVAAMVRTMSAEDLQNFDPEKRCTSMSKKFEVYVFSGEPQDGGN